MLLPLAYVDCDGPSSDLATGRASIFPAPAQPPLRLRLELPPRIHAGEPIQMRLVLQNNGAQPQDVDLGGDPLAFDIVVFSLEGSEVWSRLEMVPVPQILRTRTLDPGESLILTDTWMQRTNSGLPVHSGTYMVQGVLPVAGVPGGWGTDLYMIAILP